MLLDEFDPAEVVVDKLKEALPDDEPEEAVPDELEELELDVELELEAELALLDDELLEEVILPEPDPEVEIFAELLPVLDDDVDEELEEVEEEELLEDDVVDETLVALVELEFKALVALELSGKPQEVEPGLLVEMELFVTADEAEELELLPDVDPLLADDVEDEVVAADD